jgi:hypothetical protein|tara:strand:+ start:2757 stop:3116 length:360 start_codon:yes stop_codon:yes gene_type:complete
LGGQPFVEQTGEGSLRRQRVSKRVVDHFKGRNCWFGSLVCPPWISYQLYNLTRSQRHLGSELYRSLRLQKQYSIQLRFDQFYNDAGSGPSGTSGEMVWCWLCRCARNDPILAGWLGWGS